MNDKNLKRREVILSLVNPIPEKERFKFSIKDLTENGFLIIKNELFKVVEISTYLETKWNFNKKGDDFLITELKLFSTLTGEYTFIEWEDDDKLTIFLTTKEIRLRELRLNNGQSPTTQDIEDIAEEEYGVILYNNKKFEYIENETWAALYNSAKYKDVHVRMFEFESSDGDNLTIEVWHDDNKPSKEAFLSKELSSSAITIIKL